MNFLAIALTSITVLAVLAVTVQVLFRRFFKAERLEQHHGITEPLLGVVGTLFSVLLGFLVAAEMDRYKDARLMTDAEGNAVGDVFRLARGFGEEDRIRIRNLCRQYGNDVLDKEWPLLSKHQSSEVAWESYREMWEAVLSVEPSGERENNIHQATLESMKTVGECRRERIAASQYVLSPLLWAVIIVGAVITVAFTCLFSAQGVYIQSFMTILITITIGLNMWLLAAFSAPFSSELKIRPTMFLLLRNNIFKTPDTPPRYLHHSVKAAEEKQKQKQKQQ